MRPTSPSCQSLQTPILDGEVAGEAKSGNYGNFDMQKLNLIESQCDIPQDSKFPAIVDNAYLSLIRWKKES